MSLEQALADNTAAVKALTEITQRLFDLRSTTVDEIKAAAAGAKAAPKASAKKTEEAPAAETGGAAETKTENQPDATNRLKEVQEVCAAYAGGTDREDERTARKEKLTWLFGRVGAKKLAEIPEGKEAAVIKAVKQLIADGDLTEAPSEEAASGSDDDLLAT